jgi:transposase
MRWVAIKSVAQQDLLALHRMRTMLVKHATACANQLRALLHERGVVVARGAAALKRALANLPQENADLSGAIRGLLVSLGQWWHQAQARVAELTAQITRQCAQDERCQRLEQLVGVGPLTASALVATVGNAREFKRGRELSAYLGLVPRQHSSGGKTVMLGISKHGNRYLRTLLIHGARSALRTCGRRDDPHSRWMAATLRRRGPNVAAVAVANKHARISWALLTRADRYRAVFPPAPSADAAVKRVRELKLLILKD